MQQNQQLLEEIIELWSLVSNSKNELEKLYSKFNETEERLKKIIKQNMILSHDDEKENLYFNTVLIFFRWFCFCFFKNSRSTCI